MGVCLISRRNIYILLLINFNGFRSNYILILVYNIDNIYHIIDYISKKRNNLHKIIKYLNLMQIK